MQHADSVNPPDTIAHLLDRLDQLPSPSAVATRLITLLEDETASSRDVIDLVSTDPALSAKVVSMCARSPRGRSLGITSLDRAVVLLGFDTVRSAALSVRLFETVGGFPHGELPGRSNPGFDHDVFWRHCLAVGILSDRITRLARNPVPANAFLAGLLHDIGHLGLHAVAPDVFASACELAEAQCTSVDRVATRSLGIDGRTAGTRIARSWGLPAPLVEVIEFVDQPVDSIWSSRNPLLVSTVSLADALVARDQVSIAGHGLRLSSIKGLCSRLEVPLDDILRMRSSVLAEVESRAVELGLEPRPTPELLLDSVARANRSVGRFAGAYRDQINENQRCQASLHRLNHFLARGDHDTLESAVAAVAESACSIIAGSSACVITPGINASDDPRITFCDVDDATSVEFRAGMPADIARDVLSRNRLERCGEPIRLPMPGGEFAVLALGLPVGSGSPEFIPDPVLAGAWASALSSALLRERSHELAARLDHADQALASQRDYVSSARAASAVASLAAGVAREIDQPLSVIRERTEVLRSCLGSTELEQSVEAIHDASRRAVEIIRVLADAVSPIDVKAATVDVGMLLAQACDVVTQRAGNRIFVTAGSGPLIAHLDPSLLKRVLVEAIENALQSSHDSSITLSWQWKQADLLITVADSGPGFSAEALEKAFDPFFSGHPAPGRSGLGLSEVRRLVEAHGGRVSVENRRGWKAGGRLLIELPDALAAAPKKVPV